MPQRSLLARIERLEQAERVKDLSRFSPDCVCFPIREQPILSFPVMGDVAFRVKCPVHGDRFVWPQFHVYVPKWLREKPILRQRLSAHYQKAWQASFPLDFWPAEGEETELGVYLRLKDGSRPVASEWSWKKQQV